MRTDIHEHTLRIVCASCVLCKLPPEDGLVRLQATGARLIKMGPRSMKKRMHLKASWHRHLRIDGRVTSSLQVCLQVCLRRRPCWVRCGRLEVVAARGCASSFREQTAPIASPIRCRLHDPEGNAEPCPSTRSVDDPSRQPQRSISADLHVFDQLANANLFRTCLQQRVTVVICGCVCRRLNRRHCWHNPLAHHGWWIPLRHSPFNPGPARLSPQ